jgi:hypothetical protein
MTILNTGTQKPFSILINITAIDTLVTGGIKLFNPIILSLGVFT